jgi:hypothetical protein
MIVMRLLVLHDRIERAERARIPVQVKYYQLRRTIRIRAAREKSRRTAHIHRITLSWRCGRSFPDLQGLEVFCRLYKKGLNPPID